MSLRSHFSATLMLALFICFHLSPEFDQNTNKFSTLYNIVCVLLDIVGVAVVARSLSLVSA